MTWAVADMDEGILRREPSRQAALRWVLDHHCTNRVLRRHAYGPGAYEYRVGADMEDGSEAFIVREDQLASHGYDPEQVSLYPLPKDPHQRVDRQ